MNNNYILARWRDASTDPPEDGWCGLARHKYTDRFGNVFQVWYMSGGYMDDGGRVTMDVDSQWLDITDRPGVAREAVQAAVDEIKRIRTQTVYGYQATGLDIALDELRDHTGVTPTEVTNG